MKSIDRPINPEQTATLLHVAEYLIRQAKKMLLSVEIGPVCAVTEEQSVNAEKARLALTKALKTFTFKD